MGFSGIGTGMPSSVRIKVSLESSALVLADEQNQDGRMENMENKLGELMEMMKHE